MNGMIQFQVGPKCHSLAILPLAVIGNEDVTMHDVSVVVHEKQTVIS